MVADDTCVQFGTGAGVDCDYEAGAPLMILECMPYGDLQNFLMKYRSAC